MVDPQRSQGAGPSRNRRASGSTPRWALVLGIILAIAVVVMIVLLHITGTVGPAVH